MSDNSRIEWTEATWNPVTGCTKISPGCEHCYAETFAERFRGVAGHHFENGFDLTLRPERLDQPLRWTRPRRIFVNSMSDLFHDGVPDDFIAQVFAVMALTPQHTYQVLTKRHGRMRSLLSNEDFQVHVALSAISLHGVVLAGPWPLPNVWLGVSVENQKWADIRIPALLDTPAAVRWISAEPLLGPVELKTSHCPTHDFPGGLCTFSCSERRRLNWVVAGGESGPGARPMHPDWARGLRDQCVAASVPFFFKQWGEWAPAPSNYGPDVPERACPHTQLVFATPGDVDGQIMLRSGKHRAGRELDGRTWDQYPQAVTHV